MKDLKTKEALDYLDKLMNECRYHPDLVTKIGYFALEDLKNLLIDLAGISI